MKYSVVGHIVVNNTSEHLQVSEFFTAIIEMLNAE